ncbi:MAG: hypothetical protein ACOC1P_06355, partial [Minisyncoccales bacterium]
SKEKTKEKQEEISEDSPISGVNNLEIRYLENLTINQGDSKEIELKTRNRGVNYLNDCKLKTSKVYSSWISSDTTKGLAPGEKSSFPFELSVSDSLEKENHKIPLIVSCDELNKSIDLDVSVIKKNFEMDILDIERFDTGEINVSYSIKEVLGESSYVDVEIIFLNSNGKTLETLNNKIEIDKNSRVVKNRVVDLEDINGSEIKIVLNADSEKYSTFVAENVLVETEKSISGFSVSDKNFDSDKVFSFLIIAIFLVFSYFVLRRILKYRKKVIVQE